MFDKKVYIKEWKKKNPKKVAGYNRKYEKELKKRAHKVLKDECVLCGGKKNLDVHERKGNKHPTSVTGYYLVLKFPGKFALLCHECHRPRMHWAMKKYGFTFKQVLQYKDLLFGYNKEGGFNYEKKQKSKVSQKD